MMLKIIKALMTMTPVTVMAVSCGNSVAKNEHKFSSYDITYTSIDQSNLLASKTVSSPSSDSIYDYEIKVNANKTYQSIDGFGFALTQGAANSLKKLSENDLDKTLENLFSKKGANLSSLRIPIGSSDLSTGDASQRYTYSMVPNDNELKNFSLNGPDKTDLLPVLKKILKINPRIKIIASPWTAPIWMKSNNSYEGGRLRSDMYSVYAHYFLKYLNAMKSEGVTIDGITIQNEPLNRHNNPSMLMSKEEQFKFIDNYLGPLLEKNNIKVKIIGYDHNADVTDFPIEVAKSKYVDGSAFHLYDQNANIQNLSEVHKKTNKNIYFTEQWWGSSHSPTESNPASSNWEDIAWHAKNVLIGTLNNWSKNVIEWTLATLQYNEDYPIDAANKSVGAISVNKNNLGQYKTVYNPSYYMMGVPGKYFDPGMKRLDLQYDKDNIYATGFLKENNDRVILIYNNQIFSQNFKITDTNGKFITKVPPRTLVSIKW